MPIRPLLAALALAAVTQPAGAADVIEVAFDAPTPLAERALLAERLLHGYQATRVLALAGARGISLAGPALDPRRERWRVYAPDACHDGPCGVLVWIDPSRDATLPRDWLRVLDAHQMIFVGAHDSGNERDLVDRRVPLALFGLAGIEARHALDQRRYVAGFSGGGRAASRAAAAFPEAFAGGLYVATADGPGTVDVPLPGGDGLARLRAQRNYLVVGDLDPVNFQILRDAERAYRRACALDVELAVVRNWSHRRPDGRTLDRALDWLERGPRAAPAAHQACSREAESAARAALAPVHTALARGDRAAAKRALLAAHVAWGGMVAAEFARLLPEVEEPEGAAAR